MGHAILSTFVAMMIALSANPVAREQESHATTDQKDVSGNNAGLVSGHPFSALKYARQIRVLPDGGKQFIRNERYPVRIARDAEGRLMMQEQLTDNLDPECDHLELEVPPVCPAWNVLVIDPVIHTIAHWPEGELAAHVWIDFPLLQDRLERAAHATAEPPDVPAGFSDEDGKVSVADLGDKTVEGIRAHGMRTTLLYAKVVLNKTIQVTRIHEVWIAPDLKLIVRVIDGDPDGIETVWGLEKVSLSPDSALFQPPAGYELQHSKADRFTDHDFDYLDSWFSK